ncbi:MAG TPA: DUF3341 domain-containing protein [Gemmatimonadaceae bacterium]|nr:DUF3341 domain-containing protein [Gemmatimonadaceae bacterium]
MRGVAAAFAHLDSAVEAVEALMKKFRHIDITVFTPAPRHEFDHALHRRPSAVRLYALLGGLAGMTFGFWVPIWISDYWPLVVGGKPVASWVPYTIISFELMVLVGALSTVAGLFITARIPRITMTVGYDPRFSDYEFGVWVECPPDQQDAVRDTLRQFEPAEVHSER